MPITYRDGELPASPPSLSGFVPTNPPFAVKPMSAPPDYDRAMHMQAVDVMAAFISSGIACISKEFGDSGGRRGAHAAARQAAEVLERVSPDGVSVSRRGCTVYLIRR